MRRGALALAWAFVASSCTGAGLVGTAVPAQPRAGAAPEVTRSDAEATPRPAHVRFFVASETTDQVWVLEGDPLAVVGKVAVGRMPHNISVSPDGKWVAVANRMASSVSVIDPLAMREVARVMVGKQPHEIIWAPDATTIFVGSEREGYIHRIQAETWRPLAPLAVQVPQHAFAISKDRPNELWFTVTNAEAANVLRVYDLNASTVTQIRVADVHDVYFTPDGSEVWTTSSGFPCKPSDRIVIYDPATKKVKEEIHFAGRYPFHTMKQNRDALFYVDQTDTMVVSDHQQEVLMLIDWRERAILRAAPLKDPALAVTGKCGIQPFHTAYTPGRYYTTSNADSSVRTIDASSFSVIARVEVPAPHGIVFVPLDR